MFAVYKSDYNKIEKLMKLNDVDTFWADVRKLTKRVTSDFSLKRWLILSEMRFKELTEK